MTECDLDIADKIAKNEIEQPYGLAIELIPKMLKEIINLKKENSVYSNFLRDHFGLKYDDTIFLQ